MIIGVGIIGLLSVKILKNKYKIENITAIDISDKKLEVAAKNGANLLINLKEKDWKSIKLLNNNPTLSGSYDAVVDFVSSSQSIAIAIANLKMKGTLVVTGITHGDIVIDKLSYFSILTKELEIKGSICYVKKDFQDVIDMLANKIIKIDDVISAKYNLEEVAKAFKDWEKNYSEWYKVLLKP